MNQKKKEGFTLIELLAVIVILAIIALIAVPIIMNIINKANKSAFKDSAYGIISAGELYFSERQLEPNGMLEDITIQLPDVTRKLQMKGEVPTGSILITKEGKIAIAVYNNRYCVTKGIEDKDVTITEDYESCRIVMPGSLTSLATTSSEVTSVPECLNDGTECAPGTAVAIKVNASEVYNFYVISETNDEIILIMDRNLYSETDPNYGDVAWINASDYALANTSDNTSCPKEACNDEGPITAIKALKMRTSDWTNIPEREYTYSDDGGGNIYQGVTENMRARMLTYTEATSKEIGCTSNTRSCPDWIYINMYETGDRNVGGYWLSATNSGSHVPYYAHCIRYYGDITYYGDIHNYEVYDESTNGLRPVITLTK